MKGIEPQKWNDSDNLGSVLCPQPLPRLQQTHTSCISMQQSHRHQSTYYCDTLLSYGNVFLCCMYTSVNVTWTPLISEQFLFLNDGGMEQPVSMFLQGENQ